MSSLGRRNWKKNGLACLLLFKIFLSGLSWYFHSNISSISKSMRIGNSKIS